MKGILRSVAAATGILALGLQFWLETRLPSSGGLVRSTLHFVGYFTIVANAAAALAMLLPLLVPQHLAGRFFTLPSVRTAIAGYMVIVAVTYFVFLSHIGDDQGLERLADRLLHYVTPALFVIDWLLFVPRGYAAWRMIAASLLMPLCYGLWTMIYGARTNWWPYPFVDVARLGRQEVWTNMLTFLGAFLAIAIVLTGIDRLLGVVLGEMSGERHKHGGRGGR
jgi:hypothetical protein